MKTAVVLSSQSRELFGVVIRQSTENAFLCLTDLQRAYDLARSEHGWVVKQVGNFSQHPDNVETIYYLINELYPQKLEYKPKSDVSEFAFSDNSQSVITLTDFASNIKNKGLFTYLKELGLYRQTRKDQIPESWCDPYIWVSIAMWLNPILRVKTIIWLSDKLIYNRIAAGTLYKPMTDAIKTYLLPITEGEKAKEFIYSNEANMINLLVFGVEGKGLRQQATTKQLEQIMMLEQGNTLLIENGITDRKVRSRALKRQFDTWLKSNT